MAPAVYLNKRASWHGLPAALLAALLLFAVHALQYTTRPHSARSTCPSSLTIATKTLERQQQYNDSTSCAAALCQVLEEMRLQRVQPNAQTHHLLVER